MKLDKEYPFPFHIPIMRGEITLLKRDLNKREWIGMLGLNSVRTYAYTNIYRANRPIYPVFSALFSFYPVF